MITVYGLSNGNNSKIGWFTLSSVTPGNQTWSYMGATAIPPTAGATIAAATPSTGAATPAVSIAPLAVQSCPAGATASTGGFHVAGGQIIGPDGKAWIARGVDLHDNNLAAAAAQLPTQFPGINLVRVASGDSGGVMDPSTFADAVAKLLTARGTVVEFGRFADGFLAHVRPPSSASGPTQSPLQFTHSAPTLCSGLSLTRSNRRGTDRLQQLVRHRQRRQ